MDFAAAGRALLMIAAASSVPWAVGRFFGNRWAWPLDLGCVLPDGNRLFGTHKTWHGLVAGIAACTLIGWAIGPGWLVGCGLGAAALAGDAVSSAVKRRLNRPPGAEILGLDQGAGSVAAFIGLPRTARDFNRDGARIDAGLHNFGPGIHAASSSAAIAMTLSGANRADLRHQLHLPVVATRTAEWN